MEVRERMDKEHTAMERLRLASDMSLRLYKQPLMLTDSGGKDSAVICRLAENAYLFVLFPCYRQYIIFVFQQSDAFCRGISCDFVLFLSGISVTLAFLHLLRLFDELQHSQNSPVNLLHGDFPCFQAAFQVADNIFVTWHVKVKPGTD